MAQRGRIGLAHGQRVAADDHGQQFVQREMAHDRHRKPFGLVGDDGERMAFPAQAFEVFAHAG